jgi:mannose-1-phosphate guanylyltransferase
MKKAEKKSIIVIMAGGTGTRLWPLSRRSKPKQFHAFLSGKTLLEETYDRAKLVVPEENIYISTGEKYKKLTLETLPDFPEKSLIIEPFPMGTAPAIGLIAAELEAEHPGSIVATIASDHAIENEDEFVASLRTAFDTVALHPDKFVTVGINPTKPDTSLGYIRMGKEFSAKDGRRIFSVDEFKEKPDKKTAEKYLESWEYLWNAGYFIFASGMLATWAKEYSPALGTIMGKISAAIKADTLTNETLETIYRDAPEEPIEPAIVEKLPPSSRLVVPSAIRWSDVGSWDTLYEFLKDGKDMKNVDRGMHVALDSTGNFIVSDRRVIATMGVKNLVIIDTEDAILVARRDRASEMKKLVAELKNRGLERLL